MQFTHLSWKYQLPDPSVIKKECRSNHKSYYYSHKRIIGLLSISLFCLTAGELKAETWQVKYSTLLPSNSGSQVYDVGSDKRGNTIVVGRTFGGLQLKNPLKATRDGQTDGFVIKFNSLGQVVFSTYL